jgi:nucleoside-diphosphate-sugar epimerase
VKVLVTGGTGFIGGHLIERLHAEGHEVSALARSTSKADLVAGLGADPVRGDLGNAESLNTAARDQDLIFHVAGLVKARNEQEFFRVNRDGTRKLLAAAAGCGEPRFVFVSSLAAAGPTVPGKRRSTDEPPGPVTAYGRSKLAAEQAVRECDLPWTIVRPPMVYGPRDTELLQAFKLVRKGVAPVLGAGDQELSAIYITDLVDALARVATPQTAVGRTYCACHPEIFTNLDLARGIARAVGRRVRIVRLPGAVARALLTLTGAAARIAGRTTTLNRDKANEFLAPAWTGDPAPLERDTGWCAGHDLASGLAATAAWYRERGWI